VIWLVAATAIWAWWRRSWSVLLVVGVATVVGSATITLAAANGAILCALIKGRLQARVQRKNRIGLPEFAEAVAWRSRTDVDLGEAIDDAAELAVGLKLALVSVASRIQSGVSASAAVAALPRTDPEVALLGAAIELAYGTRIETERIFTDAAQSLRQRRLRRHDIASQAAQGRASATAMFVLPWIAVGVDFIVSGASDVWSDPGLRLLTMVAVSLSLLGAHWSLALVNKVEALR